MEFSFRQLRLSVSLSTSLLSTRHRHHRSCCPLLVGSLSSVPLVLSHLLGNVTLRWLLVIDLSATGASLPAPQTPEYSISSAIPALHISDIFSGISDYCMLTCIIVRMGFADG